MEQLKRWRETRGLSQTKLAARADVNPATVNQIEGGKRTASPATLHKLADALGVSLYELLEGEPSPKASRRSSPEPSLLDGIEDERRSRFATAIVAAAEKWGEAMSNSAMDNAKRFGLIDAALDLSGLISERAEEEDWEALANHERREIVTTMEKLREAAERGLHQLGESMEASDLERRAKERREQIKEMTRRISA